MYKTIIHNQGKQALKRVRRTLGLTVNRDKLPAYAFPGGYPIAYICKNDDVMCPHCINKNIVQIDDAIKNRRSDWNVIASFVNYEDESLYCVHCSRHIPSAYGKDNDTE